MPTACWWAKTVHGRILDVSSSYFIVPARWWWARFLSPAKRISTLTSKCRRRNVIVVASSCQLLHVVERGDGQGAGGSDRKPGRRRVAFVNLSGCFGLFDGRVDVLFLIIGAREPKRSLEVGNEQGFPFGCEAKGALVIFVSIIRLEKISDDLF